MNAKNQTAGSGLIYQRLASVMSEIGAIGKDRTNEQQGFKFRGIDQVYNAIHPLMSKYKVLSAPRVLEMMARHDRQTRTGGIITFTMLKTEYDFICGDDGSTVTVGPIISEGMDSGDKGCAKALAVAHKYAIFQLFMIPTEEAIDGDFDTYQVAPMNQPLTPAQYNQQFQNGPQLPPQPQPVAVNTPQAVAPNTAILHADDAMRCADMLIDGVAANSASIQALAGFWTQNKREIDTLDQQYHDQYERVKYAFTQARQSLQSTPQGN